MSLLYKQFPIGRVGNALFEYAFIKALSVRIGVKYFLPQWGGSKFFKMGKKWPLDNNEKVSIVIKEPSFDFCKELISLKKYDIKKNINFLGYFQSEKYFEDVWDDIKDDFLFNKDYRSRFDDFKVKDTDWAVHVRRGDYIGHKKYINLADKYYIDFFNENKDSTFYIFSDDTTYCNEQFVLKNVVVVNGHSDIDCLCMMSKFKNLYIANSTFSWWGAKLAELYNEDVNVIRPNGIFKIKIEGMSGLDFYSQRWKPRFKEKDTDNKVVSVKDFYKLDDITFVIPVSYDSKDRKENLNLVYKYIRNFFGNVEIIVAEQGSGGMFKYIGSGDYIKYVYYDDIKVWHRTKIINRMINMIETSYVAVWDADVIVPPDQVFAAFAMLTTEGYDFVYPYDGNFVKMKKSWTYKINMDVDFIGRLNPTYDKMRIHKQSFGGAFLANKDSYLKAGLENENFMIWGREDVERYERITKLGFNVGRADGCLYHLDHYLGDNSTSRNEYHKQNMIELDNVRRMDAETLKRYVKSWPWVVVK